jgi:hypothetical protein
LSKLDFGFGARTGGQNNTHFIKNLLVTKLGTNTNNYNIDNVSPIAINNNDNSTILSADTSATFADSGKLIVGSSTTDANLTLLQPDSYNTFADTATCATTTNQGAMYYNTNTAALRGCVNGNWEDLVTTSGLGILAYGVVPDSSNATTVGDLGGISGYNKSPCMVTKTGANQVTVQPCIAYSGGRKVIVPSTNLTPSLAANAFVNICLSGASNQPALGTANATENLASVPTFSANNPILCLATVKGGGSASTIGNIYDIRTFTNTQKTFATINSVNSPGWIVINSGATSQVTTATANSAVSSGVIVSTTETASTNTINAIIAINGPQFAKATGTVTIGDAFQTSTVTGYGSAAAATPTANAMFGRVLRGIDTTCTSTVSGDCEFSAYLRLSLN